MWHVRGTNKLAIRTLDFLHGLVHSSLAKFYPKSFVVVVLLRVRKKNRIISARCAASLLSPTKKCSAVGSASFGKVDFEGISSPLKVTSLFCLFVNKMNIIHAGSLYANRVSDRKKTVENSSPQRPCPLPPKILATN